ncbi:TPA: hypothetical protein N0F65_007667 [Lagenidium giganteum]|uniref:Uncharacterized protein n=1 Tax=Lagenidium giganteum TaxID=4803 RepID=A0AAV2Z6C4_9STRA|nr:TPA: hypothetical protein N0F65_007667 [Lagenidium giganteum]
MPPPPPARPAPSVDEVVEELETKAMISGAGPIVPVVTTHYPHRPGVGTQGRPFNVYANHFRVKFSKSGDVYHYDVAMAETARSFTNEGLPKPLAHKVMQLLLKEINRQHPNICVVSDNRKNIYTPAKLPFAEKVFPVVLREDTKERTYNCMVKEADPVAVRVDQLEQLFAGRLNYTPYDAIQALDVALRNTGSTRFVTVGRSLFSRVGAGDIGEGAEVWMGFYQSLRPTQNRLVVNIDMAATAFVKAMSVLEFLVESLGVRDNQTPPNLLPHQHAAFSKSIRGVKVQVTHRPGIKRAYRVNGLTKTSARDTTFEDDQGRRVSVEQYFQKAYNVRLRYPGLPCLHVGAINKKNYLPMEVCRIMEGQKTPRKVTDKQVANMIRFTATKPHIRKAKIEEKVREAGFSNDPTLRAFGLEVDPNMVTTRARLLPAPEMAYGKNAVQRPSGGSWNMAKSAFFDPKKITSWVIINNCGERFLTSGRILGFFAKLIDQAERLGMSAPRNPPPIVATRGPRDSVTRLFGQAVADAEAKFGVKPQIVWMVNPRQDALSYGDLKRASDSQYGIVSQCMLSKHIDKADPMTIANLLLKVNTKLGGKNTVLRQPLPKVQQKPTMIIGADVSHPSPMDTTRPSIAAVVASVDAKFIKHAASIRAQGHRVECIENLKEMAIELLKAFYKETRVKPDQIVFYRDGVSEGQFQMVLNYEVAALRAAFASLEKDYCPAITFVVVQKRHHTRLFVSDSRDSDRSGNVPAGTVVDTGICHPIEHDFYLMSHAGIQGTSRPAHYHVLLDEMGFSADDLQTLTYRLCYTYARCTRSVSIVPAAYYAHLLAFRARFLLAEGSDTASSFSTMSQQETDLRMLPVHEQLRNVLFYV